jgi:HK97 family phage portal protein
MLPWPVQQRINEGTNERRREHPVYRLLNEEPNEEMASVSLRRSWHLHTMIWGNGRIEIVRDRLGQPRELWLLVPDRTETRRADETRKLIHRYRKDTGGYRDISHKDVIHTAGLGYDGLVGYGLIRQLAKENIGLALAISQYAQSFFGNSTILGAILSAPNVMSDEQRAANVKAWNEARQGPDKAFGAVMMDGGLTVSHAGVENEHAQTLELMTFSVQDIARWTGVPPPMLMELSNATFTNITEQGIWYVKYTLAPWFKVYEQEATRKLFTRAERDAGYHVKFVAEGLLRGDFKARVEGYDKLNRMGVYSVNDILELEDRNTIGEDGDLRLVNMNLQTLEAAGEAKPQGNAQPGPPGGFNQESSASVYDLAAAAVPTLADTLERMWRVAARAEQRAESSGADMDEWAATFYAKHTGKLRAALVPVVETCAGIVRAALPAGVSLSGLEQFASTYAMRMADAHAKPDGRTDARDVAVTIIQEFVAQVGATCCEDTNDGN